MYQDKMVEIGGVQTRVFIAGEGDPLVWINGTVGLTGTEPFFVELAKNNKVYLVESPGFGDSEKIEWIREAADYNYFYREFLDYYNLDKVILAGHSIGGRIALEFAISHPHRVHKLVLLAPQGAYVEGVKVPDYFLGYSEYKARLMWHDESRIQQFLNKEPNKEEELRAERSELALARLIWERNYNPRFPTLLKYASVPTCIIWGKEDRLYPLAHGEFFNKHIQNSELHIVEDGGHVLHIEKSNECSSVINDFLANKILEGV